MADAGRGDEVDDTTFSVWVDTVCLCIGMIADDRRGLECNAVWWMTLLLPSSVKEEGGQIGTITLLAELFKNILGVGLKFIILECWGEALGFEEVWVASLT